MENNWNVFYLNSAKDLPKSVKRNDWVICNFSTDDPYVRETLKVWRRDKGYNVMEICKYAHTKEPQKDWVPLSAQEWVNCYAESKGLSPEVLAAFTQVINQVPAVEQKNLAACNVEFVEVSVQGFGAFENKAFYQLNEHGVHLVTADITGIKSNGFGKSTLSTTAILWCLTGECDDKVGGKPNSEHLLHSNSSTATVVLNGNLNGSNFMIERKLIKQKNSIKHKLKYIFGKDIEKEKEEQSIVKLSCTIAKELFNLDTTSPAQFRDFLLCTIFWNRYGGVGLLDSMPIEIDSIFGWMSKLDWSKFQSVANTMKSEADRVRAELNASLQSKLLGIQQLEHEVSILEEAEATAEQIRNLTLKLEEQQEALTALGTSEY